MTRQITQPNIVPAHEAPVMTVAFSPNGEWMVTGDTERRVKLWKDQSPVHSFDFRSADEKVRPTERLRAAVFSPDGRTLYLACGDHLRAIDCASGEQIWQFIPRRRLCFLVVSPISLAVRPNGDVLVATNSGKLDLWDGQGRFKSGSRESECPTHIDIMADGRHWVGTDGYKIGLWDVDSGVKTQRYVSEDRFYALVASPCENLIAVRTLHSVQILDMDEMIMREEFPTGLGLPLLDFSPDGRHIAIGREHGVEIYRLGGTVETEIEIDDVTLISLAYSPDGKLAGGFSDGTVRIWAPS